jgi:uncharacterized protein (UPF0335 family)
LSIPPDTIARHQHAACLAQLERLAEERQHVETAIDQLALELAIRQLEAVLGWIEQSVLMPSD